MAINYSIDAEARIVRLTYVGESTAAEYEAAMRAIFRAPSYRPGFGFLSDRRDSVLPTAAYIRDSIAFAAQYPEQFRGARWATVVSSVVMFGLGRMAQSYVEAREGEAALRVFRDMAEAEAWLLETDPLK